LANKSAKFNKNALLFPNFKFKNLPKSAIQKAYDITHPNFGYDPDFQADLVKAAEDAGMKFSLPPKK
jgi:hypothetical protein